MNTGYISEIWPGNQVTWCANECNMSVILKLFIKTDLRIYKNTNISFNKKTKMNNLFFIHLLVFDKSLLKLLISLKAERKKLYNTLKKISLKNVFGEQKKMAQVFRQLTLHNNLLKICFNYFNSPFCIHYKTTILQKIE